MASVIKLKPVNPRNIAVQKHLPADPGVALRGLVEAREWDVSGRCPAGRGCLTPETALQVFRVVKSAGKILSRLTLSSDGHLLPFCCEDFAPARSN